MIRPVWDQDAKGGGLPNLLVIEPYGRNNPGKSTYHHTSLIYGYKPNTRVGEGVLYMMRRKNLQTCFRTRLAQTTWRSNLPVVI